MIIYIYIMAVLYFLAGFNFATSIIKVPDYLKADYRIATVVTLAYTTWAFVTAFKHINPQPFLWGNFFYFSLALVQSTILVKPSNFASLTMFRLGIVIMNIVFLCQHV